MTFKDLPLTERVILADLMQVREKIIHLDHNRQREIMITKIEELIWWGLSEGSIDELKKEVAEFLPRYNNNEFAQK